MRLTCSAAAEVPSVGSNGDIELSLMVDAGARGGGGSRAIALPHMPLAYDEHSELGALFECSCIRVEIVKLMHR
jgi:hypothetical protein